MKITRCLVLLSVLALFAASAMAQDSLLGKKKGGGGGSSGGSSGSSSSSRQGSHHDRNSGGGSNNNNSGDNSYQAPAPNDPSRQDHGVYNDRRRSYGSRSGRVNYGTTNNLLNRQTTHHSPIHITPAPTQRDLNDDVANMRDQIRREDRSHAHDRDHDRDDSHWDHDGWNDGDGIRFRVGYYQYNNNFRDDYFCYPYYVFDPYQTTNCVVSPWYYYSYLPAYVNCSRLVISTDYSDNFIGFPYDYQGAYRYHNDDEDRDARYDNNYVSRQALDYAIDDIVNAFTQQDRRAVDRLVPRNGTVTLSVDGTISYGVRADDFYDMLMDAVMNSRTIKYEILKVKSNDDEAEVVAKHDYLDSWGNRQCVYHKFHLYGERGNIVIRYFETTNNYFM